MSSSMTIANLLCAPTTPSAALFSLTPNTICIAAALPDSGFAVGRSLGVVSAYATGHKGIQVPPPPPPLPPASSKFFLLSSFGSGMAEESHYVEKRRHSVQEQLRHRAPVDEQRRFSVQEQHKLAVEERRRNSVEEQRRNSFEEQRRNSFEEQRRNSFEEQRRNSFEEQRRSSIEEERRNSVQEECNRRESLEEKFESTEHFATIVVFVHEVKPESTRAIHLASPTEANIWDISSKIQAQTGISRSSQKVTVLVSPEPRVYLMAYISEHDARGVIVPLTASVLVSNTQSRPQQQVPQQQVESERCLNTFPLRSGRQLKIASSESPSPQDSVLNEVRQRLTEVLCDIRKHVSLDMIARITTRSKSSLSLWRRGMYRGNNLLIAKAVTAALQVLEINGWKYAPEIHNGSIRL